MASKHLHRTNIGENAKIFLFEEWSLKNQNKTNAGRFIGIGYQTDLH